MTSSELVTVASETAQALSQTSSGRIFVKSTMKVLDALPGVPGMNRDSPFEARRAPPAANGLGNKEIADRLGTATGTIKIHIQNILGKLSASDRIQAVTIAIQRGILHLS
ncbi:MAG: LuxR C-terminal-related transcriptional regulator [Vicinamibacterales bacterium]|nr:LuxR C-terminal-related transcriptional regulator [Vicinamibacterales bacterium]